MRWLAPASGFLHSHTFYLEPLLQALWPAASSPPGFGSDGGCVGRPSLTSRALESTNHRVCFHPCRGRSLKSPSVFLCFFSVSPGGRRPRAGGARVSCLLGNSGHQGTRAPGSFACPGRVNEGKRTAHTAHTRPCPPDPDPLTHASSTHPELHKQRCRLTVTLCPRSRLGEGGASVGLFLFQADLPLQSCFWDC